MTHALLTHTGQIKLPESIRVAHQWTEGMQFEISDTPDGLLLRPIAPYPMKQLDQVVGCVGYTGQAVSIEDMDAGIAAGIERQFRTLSQ